MANYKTSDKTSDKKSFAFVVPRFGEAVTGGAEQLVSEIAGRLAAAGHQIDILSTCAVDNRTWDNHFEPGETQENGLSVRRFLVNERDLDQWIPLQITIADGGVLGAEQQLDWMQQSVNSDSLYEYIADNKQKYDWIFFAPYLFGTTFWGSLIAPKKSVLIPCLHDEAYAYTDVIQSMFRQVGKCMFNAPAEQELAENLYGNLLGSDVGMGFDLLEQKDVDDLAPYFQEGFPYLLYLGRKETGKNLHLLIDYFTDFIKQSGSNLKLVIAGAGDISDVAPNGLMDSQIIDLPRVSEEDKQRLLKNAQALCQPSTNESFSIVLMEAWELGTPVLVHSDCAVTREHVKESKAGMHFRTAEEFSQTLEGLAGSEELFQMGIAGREYVANRYSWQAVMERFWQLIDMLDESKRELEENPQREV